MSDTLTSSCELLLALGGVYLLAVGLLTAGLPRILMGPDGRSGSSKSAGTPASAK